MTVQTMLTNATHVSQKQSSTETMWVNDQRTNSERVPCRPAIVKVPPWDPAACARSEPLQSPRPRTRTPWLLHPSACCFVTPAPIPEDLKYRAPGHAGELERTCLCRQLPDFCYGMGSHRVFLTFLAGLVHYSLLFYMVLVPTTLLLITWLCTSNAREI